MGIFVQNPISTIRSNITFYSQCSFFVSIIILFILYQRSIEKENDLMLMWNELQRVNTDKYLGKAK